MSFVKVCRLFVPGVVTLLFGLSPGTALAGDEVVDGVTKEFNASDVFDNLTVKNGGVATIHGSTIKGNLTVEGQNSLAIVYNGLIGKNVTALDDGMVNLRDTKIKGSLEGDECRQINLWVVQIGHNVHLTGCVLAGYFGYVSGNVKVEQGGNFMLHGWKVAGNVSATDNQGAGWTWPGIVGGCTIGGNLQVTGNKVQNLLVSRATVGKNLQVTDNTPKAVVTNTTVGGKMDVE